MLRFAAARLTAQWRGILTIIIGTLLAAMVAAAMPLYTTAVNQIGMVQRLQDNPAADIHILARTGLNAAAAADRYAALDAVVRAEMAAFAPFGDWMGVPVAFTETADMFIVVDGVDFTGFKARLTAYEGSGNLITWQGRAPESTADGPIEIGMPGEVAAQLGVGIGDVITLDQRGWASSVPIPALIVGIPEPAAEASELPVQIIRAAPDASLIAAPESLLRAAGSIPDTRITAGWWTLFDHAALPYSALPAAAQAAEGYTRAVASALAAALGTESTGIVVQTRLPEVLRGVSGDVSAIGAPFVLLLLQLSALVFYFLLVTGALVRRSERRELSVLQTRGAYRRQILLIRGLEALMICAAAVLVAPVLARAFLTAFIPLVTGVDRLPLSLSAVTFVYAGGAALIALAVLLVTLWGPLNLPLIAAGGSAERSGAAAFFQRYYLDVLLLAVGLIALSQLTAHDANRLGSDPVLLLGPTLLFFAMSSLSLRLFPLLTRTLVGVAARFPGLTAALAGWQVNREPLHYARITLMLALAVSVGWFGISYHNTVEQNRRDQASYLAGGDVRLRYDPARRDPLPAREVLLAQPETSGVAYALRIENVSLAPVGVSTLDTGTLLAVEPDALVALSDWRADVGPLPVPAPLPDYGRTLPDGATAVSLDLQLAYQPGMGGFLAHPAYMLVNEHRILALVASADGQQAAVTFDPQLDAATLAQINSAPPNAAVPDALADLTWLRFSADLSGLMPPVSFKGIAIETAVGRRNLNLGGASLGLRDLALTVDGAEAAADWLTSPALTPVALGGVDISTPLAGLEAPAGSEFSVGWTQQSTSGLLTLLLDGSVLAALVVQGPQPDGFALSAVLSPRYAAQHNLTPGQKFALNVNQATLWFRVDAVAPYFPTLIDADELYVVTDYAGLSRMLALRPRASAGGNEAWIGLADGASGEAWLNGLAAVPEAAGFVAAQTRTGVLDTLRTDLLTTGLIGLLLLGFVIALTLCVVSLATYTGITLQARRGEFAVLHALGWQRRQMVFSILTEQVMVMVVGVALGLVIGVLLSAQVLPGLGGSDTGNVLPYVVRPDPGSLLLYVALMAALFGVQIVFGALAIRRQTAQVLRRGDSE
jgi:hypothetical protein